jgi:N-acetyl-anhydromuramyl-L-alanine amidase AmpD
MVPMGQPDRITVHHSAMFLVDSGAEAEQQMRRVQREHVQQRGWGDIGYHFLVDRSGRILEGRDLRWQGAHAGDDNANRQNIGICLLGNFHPGQERAQRPTQPQIQTLETLLRVLCKSYAIPTRRIYTHVEIHPQGRGATECPGAYLQPVVDVLRRRLASNPPAVTRAGN